MTETTEKKAGRPRKHNNERAKVQAWRKNQTGRRLDGFIDNSASWRLERLAKAKHFVYIQYVASMACRYCIRQALS